MQGVVTDISGAYVKAAIVTVLRETESIGETEEEAVTYDETDENGRFLIQDLNPDDKYIIEIYVKRPLPDERPEQIFKQQESEPSEPEEEPKAFYQEKEPEVEAVIDDTEAEAVIDESEVEAEEIELEAEAEIIQPKATVAAEEPEIVVPTDEAETAAEPEIAVPTDEPEIAEAMEEPVDMPDLPDFYDPADDMEIELEPEEYRDVNFIAEETVIIDSLAMGPQVDGPSTFSISTRSLYNMSVLDDKTYLRKTNLW